MPRDDQAPQTAGDPGRRYLIAGALLGLAIVSVGVLFITRNEDPGTRSSIATRSEASLAPSSTRPDTGAEVTMRLRQILEIREQAFRERDPSLFEDVYSSDCPCLRAGRDAIDALKKENVVWTERSISLEVQSVRSLNTRLWEVDALFLSESFRIETEEGRLVREAPAERLRYRFLLVRSSSEEPWRLGSATLVEG